MNRDASLKHEMEKSESTSYTFDGDFCNIPKIFNPTLTTKIKQENNIQEKMMQGEIQICINPWKSRVQKKTQEVRMESPPQSQSDRNKDKLDQIPSTLYGLNQYKQVFERFITFLCHIDQTMARIFWIPLWPCCLLF